MKKLFFILIAAVITQVQADDFKVYMHTFDENVDDSKIDDPAIIKSHGPSQMVDSMKELPSPDKIKGMFLKAGLKDQLKAMDDMERDILVAKLLNRPLDTVIAQYTDIDAEKLTKLKNLLSTQP